ncbi:hypothetical protein GCM10028895_11890 [Pontibacter rugosus]
MTAHQLQPSIKTGGSKNKGSKEHSSNTKQQLPTVESLLSDSATLQVLLEYYPNFRKLGTVFRTPHSKGVNIFRHKGIYLVKDFTGKEFGEGALNVLQVIQCYHGCDFQEALAFLAAKLGHTSSGGASAPPRWPVPRPTVPAGTEKEREQVLVNVQQWERVMQDPRSNFHRYALSLGVTEEHLNKWHVGTDTRGNTVFGHRDTAGAFVNLKHFAYQPSGSRDKSKKPFYLKNPACKKYGQCLYGIHLLREGVPMVLVEAEKTAGLASFFTRSTTSSPRRGLFPKRAEVEGAAGQVGLCAGRRR